VKYLNKRLRLIAPDYPLITTNQVLRPSTMPHQEGPISITEPGTIEGKERGKDRKKQKDTKRLEDTDREKKVK